MLPANNPARNPDESYEDYRERRKAWNGLVKLYLEGRPVYRHPLPQEIEHNGKKVMIQPPKKPYVKEKTNEQVV